MGLTPVCTTLSCCQSVHFFYRYKKYKGNNIIISCHQALRLIEEQHEMCNARNRKRRRQNIFWIFIFYVEARSDEVLFNA